MKQIWIGLILAGLMSASAAAQTEFSLPAGFDAGAPQARDYANLLQQIRKPGGRRGSQAGGDDSCRWANDRECDEPGLGTGACEPGTDYSDCWRLMEGVEDDSCPWANDGECDEPGIGTGACTQATDASDCGAVAHLRFQTDHCDTAFNGICEDRDRGGTGACAARSDRADCLSRERPLTIKEHFFGRDDRTLMDTGVFPWSVIGEVRFETGGGCSASLVSERVIATAAHCISENSRILAGGVFTTGQGLADGPRTANIAGFLLDPDWDETVFMQGETLDGTDWALLRLDRPLGAELGHLRVIDLDTAPGQLRNARVRQAGYSWDTGENLSGDSDCRMLDIFEDNTISHDCDTTHGDSGSPLMVRSGEEWLVTGTISNFRPNPNGPMAYIATGASRWADQLADFEAGRIGTEGLRLAGPGKPGALAPVKK